MISKFVRGIMFFFAVTSLLGGRAAAGNSRVQASAADHFVTGIMFSQPADQSGRLYLSSWLDPDGSNYDQYIWDNFTLPSNETITEIDWVGGYDPTRNGGGGPVINFIVSIYPSIAAGTEPDVAYPPLVVYNTGGNAGETPIGTVNGTALKAYAYNLPAPFAASAGIKYWVQIFAFQQGIIPDWGLASASGGNSSHYVKGSGAGGDVRYYPIPGDTAFSLLGDIPPTPTDIWLSNTAVDENLPVNTIVGALEAASLDPAATFTFSLACLAPGADDALFIINGTNLHTSTSFDFEVKNMFDVCIHVSDQGGQTLDQNFIINVNDINEAPTAVLLSNSSVDENQPANTVVGALSAIDPDAGASITFSLSCAVSGADDAMFNISETSLRASASFNFEAKTSYSICIRAADQGGLSFSQNFTIVVNNLKDASSAIFLPLIRVD